MYVLPHCYEELDAFKRSVAEVETQCEQRVKTLRIDCGWGYLSCMFKDFCEEKGIRRQLMIPSTPQQNGVAKHRNQTLFDMFKSIMTHANLPISFWGGYVAHNS